MVVLTFGIIIQVLANEVPRYLGLYSNINKKKQDTEFFSFTREKYCRELLIQILFIYHQHNTTAPMMSLVRRSTKEPLCNTIQ